MRYSVDKKDSGHINFIRAIAKGDIVILLDGEPQRSVITADEDSGIVVRYKLNDNGRPQQDPSDPSKAWVETINGGVEVQVEPRSK